MLMASLGLRLSSSSSSLVGSSYKLGMMMMMVVMRRTRFHHLGTNNVSSNNKLLPSSCFTPLPLPLPQELLSTPSRVARRSLLHLLADNSNVKNNNNNNNIIITNNHPSLFPLFNASRHYASKSYPRQQSLGQNAEPTLVKAVPVQVANELLNAGYQYLDVRTAEEFKAGHVDGAINIPYMYKTGLGMSKNRAFLEAVKATFGNDDEILVGCQSGRRSQMAVAELIAAGFTGMTDMAGGYIAWTQSGLATSK